MEPVEIFEEENYISNGFEQKQPYLSKWSRQLLSVMTDPRSTDTAWESLGRGLVIEGSDFLGCEKFLRDISSCLGIKFRVAGASVLDQLESIDNPSEIAEIILIEKETWYLSGFDEEQDRATRSALKGLLNRKCNRHLIFVIHSKSYVDIDISLRHVGQFDRHIKWMVPKPIDIAEDFISRIGAGWFHDEILRDKPRLGILLHMECDSYRRIGIMSKAMYRIAYFENKKICWKDILQLLANGTGEGFITPPSFNLDGICVHEAGHALAALLESKGKNIPDMATTLPGRGYLGMVIENLEYTYESNGSVSYEQACSKIRIALAGRAAEHLINGANNIDVYFARDDLKFASRIATDLIDEGGFHYAHGSGRYYAENLLVDNKANHEDVSANRKLINKLLKNQYEVIYSMLKLHKERLLKISRALAKRRILLSEDFVALGLI